MPNEVKTKSTTDQNREDGRPCANPSCGCGPDCRCGDACVCTPAANCTRD